MTIYHLKNSINISLKKLEREMVQSVSFLQQSRKTEYKAKRNSARAFCPIKCITHKHKNKHVFRDWRAEVVLGTFNFESLGLSRR